MYIYIYIYYESLQLYSLTDQFVLVISHFCQTCIRCGPKMQLSSYLLVLGYSLCGYGYLRIKKTILKSNILAVLYISFPRLQLTKP